MASEFVSSAGSTAVGTLMVDYLVKPIVCRYLFRFNRIVEDLREKQKMLITSRTQLQHDVNEAKLQNGEIENDVNDWLTNAENVLQAAHGLESRIQDDQKCFNCCPNPCWRYRLSKEIDEKTQSITQLVDTSKFDRISHRVTLLPGIEFFLPNDLIASKSLTSALNEIIEALKHDGINKIGVWGVRGVGKTTLVHAVGNKAKETQLFDHVVMAVVPETQHIGKIQDKIADSLDLTFEKLTQEGRAMELWLRLKIEKRILIILDDIHKALSLKDIGIPFGEDHRGCKIIFTTRNKHVCNTMECQSIFSFDVLDEEAAWSLFKMHARLDNASPAISTSAMEVSKGCKGIPLAIVRLAKALSGKPDNVWKSACHKLKSSKLMDIEYLQEEEKQMLTSILNN